MGALYQAFKALIYAIVITILLMLAAFFFGIAEQFGALLSTMGFVVIFFLIYGLIGARGGEHAAAGEGAKALEGKEGEAKADASQAAEGKE